MPDVPAMISFSLCVSQLCFYLILFYNILQFLLFQKKVSQAVRNDEIAFSLCFGGLVFSMRLYFFILFHFSSFFVGTKLIFLQSIAKGITL